MVMPDYRLLPAGDTALVVEFGDRIDRQLSAWVLALKRRLNEIEIDGIVETVPTFRSLTVHYDPLALSSATLIAQIDALMPGLRPIEIAGRLWRLPVCYDAHLAPDLDEVVARTGLSPARMIEQHSAVTYHVYMLGFLPGQAYMGDIPRELALPRRMVPRLKIPAGSLAIASTMTCIFPLETPCGWYIIGRSPIPLWDRKPGSEPLLAPGDKVTFAPISFREYEVLLAKVADGQFRITAEGDTLEAAA
jgi:KipI family sensor histidine kinase inhibitor